MRGRYPKGLEAVDELDGSEQAKQRVKVILETLTGQCRVQEACERLGISEPRYQQLRQRLLEGALATMEAGKPGRPKQVPTEAQQQIALLEARLEEMTLAAQTTQAREEIALILSRADQAEDEPATPEKKTTRRPGRLRPRRPGQQKNT